jgi:predicted transcriptional regulator
MSTTIRVSDQTRQRVAALASATGRQMQSIVDDAVTEYERTLFWAAFEAGYERIADSPDEWNSVRAERAEEESALTDDLA